jgi:pyruvate formate lyase activating enzyme
METLSRRTFMRRLIEASCIWSGASCWPFLSGGSPASGLVWAAEGALKEVMFYRRLEGGRIECGICPRRCEVAPGERGFCGNKENREGKYYLLTYNQVCAAHLDPIEKKPLFHYLPGTVAFSIATAGCNLKCKFCQNWEISQSRPEEIAYQELTSRQAVEVCQRSHVPTIAFTYSEPTVFYSYMYEVAGAARSERIGSVMISNGFMNEEPLRELCTKLTAVKIDLKSFSDKFYREVCSGELEAVLATLKRLKEIGTWFEIVNLLIPTLNDDPRELKRMCEWIKTNLGQEVPVHFTRFHPIYQLQNLPPTPLKSLETARGLALEAGLRYAYVGNVFGHPGESTYCPSCKKVVIGRVGHEITENNLNEGTCKFCRRPIAGIWRSDQVLG